MASSSLAATAMDSDSNLGEEFSPAQPRPVAPGGEAENSFKLTTRSYAPAQPGADLWSRLASARGMTQQPPNRMGSWLPQVPSMVPAATACLNLSRFRGSDDSDDDSDSDESTLDRGHAAWLAGLALTAHASAACPEMECTRALSTPTESTASPRSFALPTKSTASFSPGATKPPTPVPRCILKLDDALPKAPAETATRRGRRSRGGRKHRSLASTIAAEKKMQMCLEKELPPLPVKAEIRAPPGLDLSPMMSSLEDDDLFDLGSPPPFPPPPPPMEVSNAAATAETVEAPPEETAVHVHPTSPMKLARGSMLKEEASREFSGTIKMIHQVHGYGFITCPEVRELCGRDVYLPKALVQDGAHVGQSLVFTMRLSSKARPMVATATFD
mmetsp:Transcript_11209/g.32340  ORF Transcript_11209/g.32340 Transcript_11209/m.32340 type:complete len:387 (-) Transcript_11209:158-1318(-)